jgi:hypothetical protein
MSDFNAFVKRFWHFVDVTDPRTLIYSDDEIREASTIAKESQRTNMICGDEASMAHYKKLASVGIHPITGEVIPRLFRVSAIAPV